MQRCHCGTRRDICKDCHSAAKASERDVLVYRKASQKLSRYQNSTSFGRAFRGRGSKVRLCKHKKINRRGTPTSSQISSRVLYIPGALLFLARIGYLSA